MIKVMYFEAYPLIFQGVYGISNGIAGLAFIPSKINRLRPPRLSVVLTNSSRRWSLRRDGPFLMVRLYSSQRKIAQGSLVHNRRVPKITSGMCWGTAVCLGLILAGVDCLSGYSLDCAHARGHTVWDGILSHLRGSHQLFG